MKKNAFPDCFRPRCIDIIAFILFFVCMLIIIPSEIYAAEPILLNFESRETNEYTRFDALADFATIRRWALNRNLSVIPDNPPFADKSARFVSRSGSSVKIRNLNPNSQYTLFIDFVSYGGGNGGIVSRLDIRCDGEKLSEFRFGEQGPAYFAMPIPRNCSMDGEITISFDEFSSSSGLWGIWDMILSGGALPDKITYVKEIPAIKDSSGNAPDPKGGKKDKPVPKKEVPGPAAKPSAKPVIEPKDVIIPESKDIPEIKKPDPAKTNVPKLPDTPKVKDVRD
jgi:hypothetical protein